MKTSYTVKNFKVFDKKGVSVPIAPLTFLVGCNSSGKSSIVKSLTLLKTHFDQTSLLERKSFMDSYLDFNVKPNESLGKFPKVINDKISRAKDKVITLEYTIHSYYANDDIRVSLSFVEGDLGNAKLSSFRMYNSQDKLILECVDNSLKCNLSLLKNGFKDYIPARLIAKLLKPWPANDFSKSRVFKDDEKKQIEAFRKEYEAICGADYIENVIEHRDDLAEINLKDDKDNDAFTRFEETGILTYFSVFDLIGKMNPADAEKYLLENVSDNDENLRSLIIKICDDFARSGETDFFCYYRHKENEFLAEPSTANYFCGRFLLGEEKFISNSLFNSFLPQTHLILTPDSIISHSGGSLRNDPKEAQFVDEWEHHPITFNIIYEALSNVSKDDKYTRPVYDDYGVEHNLLHGYYKQYINGFLKEVLNTDITEGLSYVSSSRVQVRRIYTLEDNNEFSVMVKNYHEAAAEFKKLNPPVKINVQEKEANYSSINEITPYSFMPGGFISKWLRAFGVGDRCSIDLDNNGIGFLLKVYRSEKDTKGVLLADMGYGITQIFSILLQIEITIMRSLTRKFEHYHQGAIVSGGFDKTLTPVTIAIEEPEIHLHPRYQSLLAEMFFEAYKEYNIQFIIETHSEYLLRKIQTIIGSEKLTPEDVSMIYVEETSEVLKGADKLRRIPIKKDGRLSEPFGPGFYDEADNLSLDLFTNMSK